MIVKRLFTSHAGLLTVILALAALPRFYNLSQQGMIFSDSGVFVVRSDQILDYLRHPTTPLKYSYVDIKIAWLTFLTFGKAVTGDAFMFGKYLSAFFGIATVLLTFLLARQFYQNDAIGYCAALFLAVSSYHVFYSRIAMPDSCATFFAMLSMYFYLLALTKGRQYLCLFLAAICFAVAFLSHYRAVFSLLFIGLLEVRSRFWRDRKQWVRYPVFIAMNASIMLGFIWLQYQILGIFYPAMFQNNYWNVYSGSFFSPASFTIYGYYIFKYDGMACAILLLASLLFLRRRYSPLWFLVLIFLQILFAASARYHFPRIISPALPFLAIIYGVSLYNIAISVGTERRRRMCLAVLALLCMLPGAMLSGRLAGDMNSSLPQAVQWLEANGKKMVLATHGEELCIYVREMHFQMLEHENTIWLNNYYLQGYQCVMVTPQKFAFCSGRRKSDGEIQLSSLMIFLAKYCQPAVVFDHFSPVLLERFLHEHDYPDVERVHRVMELIDAEDGKIKIYDIASCLRVMDELQRQND
jgi:hypothetical protein